MTIERGGIWGAPAVELLDAQPSATAATDAEVAELAAAGEQVIELVAFDGDLARTVGVERARPASQRFAYPVDLGLVQLDGGPERPFVSSVVARRRLWRGEFAIVANCGWLGDWYVGPRAHPNDGLLDVTVGALGPTQRLLARRRVTSGTHLPHPGLRTPRTAAFDHRFPKPISVSVDQQRVGRAAALRVSVQPDSFMLVV